MGRRGIFLLTFVVLVVSLSCSPAESRPQSDDAYLVKRQDGQDGEFDQNAGSESDFDLESEISKRAVAQISYDPQTGENVPADLDADLSMDFDLRKRSLGGGQIRNRRKWWHYIPGVGHIAAAIHRHNGDDEAADAAEQKANAGFKAIKKGIDDITS